MKCPFGYGSYNPELQRRGFAAVAAAGALLAEGEDGDDEMDTMHIVGFVIMGIALAFSALSTIIYIIAMIATCITKRVEARKLRKAGLDPKNAATAEVAEVPLEGVSVEAPPPAYKYREVYVS